MEQLEARHLLAANLVLDINVQPSTIGSTPTDFVDVGGVLFFTATDAVHGRELWKSDGTEQGTVLVKDIVAGTGSGNPRYLTNVAGTLYFIANDGIHGSELWKSDGTDQGTVLVKDVYAGNGSSNPFHLTNVDGTLYFIANDGTHGNELWKSDGTEDGTVLVKDIRPGSGSSIPDNSLFGASLSDLTNVGGTLYFRANDGVNGYELWKSDGTDQGTVLVKDIRPGSGGGNPRYLTNVGGTLYFRANDGTHGYELWKSDGTDQGTILVKNIRAGSGSSIPSFLTNVGGTLYFRADDGIHGNELWKSNGTELGTVLVKDIHAGSGSSFPSFLTNVGGTLYFGANDGANGNELWKSDGTEQGTVLVKDIRTGSGSSIPSFLTHVGGTLYFRADDGVNGNELWKSDGTDQGTVLVKDIRAGSGSSIPSFLTHVGGTLYFRADDGTHGNELWKSDGTDQGTVLVKDIHAGSGSSSPSHLTDVGGTLYFSTNDGTHGSELWKSDGTQQGTVLVKDIHVGSGSSFPSFLTNVGGTLYFNANDGVNGNELWKSDGSEQGTVLVKDIVAGTGSGNPRYLTNVDGTLYFRANDGTHGNELWKSDGTAQGTVLVKDIRDGSGSSNPHQLTNVGGTLYFMANDGVNGYELWKSDGTDQGTVLVKDIHAGSGSSFPSFLTDVGGTLYFRANDGVNGNELWKSDGTDQGTVLVKDIRPGSGGSIPRYLTNVGGSLYFMANDGVSGYELWKSDGTDQGTVLVKDIRPGSGGSGPRYLTNVGGSLYFSANDGVNGNELWKSDGTAQGTVLVKDIHAGSGSSGPRYLTNVGGNLYFSANDGVNGNELWKSDGTEDGTVLVADIVPGSGAGSPGQLAAVGDKLYFAATDEAHGRELWVLATGATTHITLDGSGNLVIADTAAGGKNDNLKMSFDGTSYAIEDLNGNLIDVSGISGASGSGTSSVVVPKTSISGPKIIVHTLGGDDLLTIDAKIAGEHAIEYHGGAGGNDALNLVGGPIHTSSYTYGSTNDGSVTLDPDGPGPAAPWTISFTGLAPISSSITSNVVELIYTGGSETIIVTDAGSGQTTVDFTLGEITTFVNPTHELRIIANNGSDTIDVHSLASDYASLVISGDDVTDVVNIHGPLTFAADHSLTVWDVATVNLPNSSSDIITSGSGAVSITAMRNISLAPGSSISTQDGGVTLSANQHATSTAGNFIGIEVNDAVIASDSAAILLRGRGGDAGSQQYGIHIHSGAAVGLGTTGPVTVEGTGGASSDWQNYGVWVSGIGSQITSIGGAVLVQGTGGGQETSSNNHGVVVSSSGLITSVGTVASVTVNGHGGNTSGSGGNINYGVQVSSNAAIMSSGGAVFVEGTGGGAGSSGSNHGMVVRSGGSITSAGNADTATVEVKGYAGNASQAAASHGVFVTGNTSLITSSGGGVLVEGTGAGTGSYRDNHGVLITSAGSITSAGTASTATVTVKGFGGVLGQHGVNISGTNSVITSGGGAVLVEGTGGAKGGAIGVLVGIQASITSAGSTANVTVKGSGGTGFGWNVGVSIDGNNARITSSGGPVLVEGTGGGVGSSNFGVYVGAGRLSSGGAGMVSVTGVGGPGLGGGNHGVYVQTGEITSGGGDVTISGLGSENTESTVRSYGVEVGGSLISAGGSGNVTITGVGGAALAQRNYGVFVRSIAVITSGGGDVSVWGQGGDGDSSLNYGVMTTGDAEITSGGSGNVTVTGIGGKGAGSNNVGLYVQPSTISSGGAGNVTVLGQGGGNADSLGGGNRGIWMSSGVITSGGIGQVTVSGFGGTGPVGGNDGIFFQPVTVNDVNSGDTVRISSGGGNVNVLGHAGEGPTNLKRGIDLGAGSGGGIIATGNNADVTITTDGLWVGATAEVAIDSGTGKTTLRPYSSGTLINLGGPSSTATNPPTLGFTAEVMEKIIAGTMVIGDTDSGAITVTVDITRTAATDMQLISGGDIVISGGAIDTGGGTLLLHAGDSPAAIKPTRSGTDVAASTLALASDLAIMIDGTAVDMDYTQLSVVGQVDLTGVELVLSGTYVPDDGDVLTIVSASTVTGKFNGLNEGDEVLFNGIPLTINYTATAVTLTANLNAPPVAHAGGPYYVSEGATVQLDASASTDLDQDPLTLTYAWDLDGDGVFGETGIDASRGDEVGITPTFSSLGLTPGSVVTVSVLITDDHGATDQVSTTITVLAAAPADLENVIENVLASGETQVELSATRANTDDFLQAIADLPPNTGDEVEITIILEQGTIGRGQIISVPEGYTLIVDGANGQTSFLGGSPALTIAAGDVVFKNGITLTNSTDAPTIFVQGGSLTLRNVLVEESDLYDRAAIEITGGTVDLGTAFDPGGNTFEVRGPGEAIRNLTASDVPALGNSFQVDGVDITDPFLIEDQVHHALDDAELGLVSFVAGNVAPRATIDAVSPAEVATGETVAFTGSFSDVGSIQTHTAVWTVLSHETSAVDSIMGVVNEQLSSGSVTGDYVFPAPGIYTITLEVMDEGGLSGIATTMLTVQHATPTLTIDWTGGTYDGSTFAADGSVTGFDGTDLGALTFTYFAGSNTLGTPLLAAPVNAGTYTVQADFAGDALHTPGSATATITITHATLTGEATTQDALNTAKQGMLNVIVTDIAGFVNGENAEVFLANAFFWITIGDVKYEFVPTSITKLSDSSISISYKLKNSDLQEDLAEALEEATSGATSLEAGFVMESMNYRLTDDYLARLFSTVK